MSSEKLSSHEISVGKALPWPVYNEEGKLLLQKGTIISNERQLATLLEKGLYRNLSDQKENKDYARPFQDTSSPFELLATMQHRLGGIFSSIRAKQDGMEERVGKFCNELRELCNRYPDATLGAVHLCSTTPYTLCHPLHVAILSEMMSRREGYNEDKTNSVLAAALTANISILELQEQLQAQSEPLSDTQREQIQAHPLESKRILQEAGITDPLWLDIVAQHHERIDGSGYANGLTARSILKESQLVGISDRYAAMITPRAYRPPLSSRQVLRELFLNKHRDFDEVTQIAFIKELGVYPPGTYVELANGEKSIVVKRSTNSNRPLVSSIMNGDGKPYANPLRRNTADSSYRIKDIYIPKNELRMQLNIVWGYK